MSEIKMINQQALQELFKRLKEQGKRILAPVKQNNRIIFDSVSSFSEVSEDYIQTTLSAKEAVLPRYEEIVRFKKHDKDLVVEETHNQAVPTVIYGVRPCDARSLATLNAVYTSDYVDDFFKAKIDNTIVIGLACNKADDYCFCTSLGGSPGETVGSDILLTKMDDTNYLAEIITDKGQSLVALYPEGFLTASNRDKNKYLAQVKSYFKTEELKAKLALVFDSDIWKAQSLRCLGCGACAFVCPSCSCFDMQDETLAGTGARYRSWDSCGLSLFTLHTSGHNPRETQGQRWRQRIMHKFSYEPETLKALGCVGCGRCSRACPVDMNLLEHLIEIMEAK